MKASELRIGNYIYKKGAEEKVEHLQSVDSYSGELVNGCQIIGLLQPIPLTNEWLIKFELVENSRSDRYRKRYDLPNDSFEIHFDNDGEYPVFFEGNTLTFVSYVHQLQNLYFALTGEELTIKA
ncbi:hypothetical protein [Pedobacter gandavensis]|uniref:Uncharacterized protein n=1 Tax=Pedobacter gandavensis TaxID=2679963 RepID=A0ABR6EU55_9SPHI|nr:hypothetical protein [Pedobacter gandavensis]MBB2148794.1 hypothetical protein [Pedobacter gandavensis]